ncbi:hypothetical protein [Maribacter dokdonensis]|uniref:hypothetical protein n=1 Tax=Maribacter dokdonensis TaxID=320912 RepID=UPI002AB150D9|nr:hypothetical protein [Maribacter dokdonensis]
MELLAKSELLLEPISGLENKANHNRIKSQYNKRAKGLLDKSEKNKRTVLNQLSELRNKARYLKGNGDLTFEKEEIMKTILKTIKRIESITEY